MSELLVCGIGPTGPNADVYGVHMSVVTELKAVTDSSTSAVTVLQAQSTPGFGTPTVDCSSTGALEQRIAGLIAKS